MVIFHSYVSLPEGIGTHLHSKSPDSQRFMNMIQPSKFTMENRDGHQKIMPLFMEKFTCVIHVSSRKEDRIHG